MGVLNDITRRLSSTHKWFCVCTGAFGSLFSLRWSAWNTTSRLETHTVFNLRLLECDIEIISDIRSDLTSWQLDTASKIKAVCAYHFILTSVYDIEPAETDEDQVQQEEVWFSLSWWAVSIEFSKLFVVMDVLLQTTVLTNTVVWALWLALALE